MGKSNIGGNWNFNLRTLEFDGAKRWFERVLSHSNADEFTKGVAMHAISNEWYRQHGIVPETRILSSQGITSYRNPIGCIASVLSEAHPAFIREYQRHALAARRFASSPGIHIALTNYGIDAFNGQVGVPAGVIDGAKAYLAHSDKVALLEPGESLARDLYDLLSRYAAHPDAAELDAEGFHSTSGMARRQGLLNVETGLLLLSSMGGSERTQRGMLEDEARNAFYGFLPHMTPFDILYNVSSQSLQLFFSRRDPAIDFFENFVTVVRVNPNEVKMSLPVENLVRGENGVRAPGLPLMFQYGIGARRGRWLDRLQQDLFRAEADHVMAGEPREILGSLRQVAKEHLPGAQLFVQTTGDIIEVAPDTDTSESIDFSGDELDMFTTGFGAANFLASAVAAVGPVVCVA